MKQETFPITIDTIFSPQGAEYQAVCRGISNKSVQVFPIPVGMRALKLYLQQWQQTQNFLNKPPNGVVLMGLAGSLSPRYGIGAGVLYQGCGYGEDWQNCHNILTKQLDEHLQGKLSLVRSITCDRVISLALEKSQLRERYQVDVVDMEGFGILETFNTLNIPVSIVRVISDDCQQNLPDLTAAFGEDGKLKPFVLASQMLRQPLEAINLIKSSLKALKKLQEIAKQISL